MINAVERLFNRDYVLLTGTSNTPLAQEAAAILKKPLYSCNRGDFADGQQNIQIPENVRGKNVYIIQPSYSRDNPQYSAWESLLITNAAHEAHAEQVRRIDTCMKDMRADKKDAPRVPLAGKLHAQALELAGATTLVTFDLHNEALQNAFSRCRWDNVYTSVCLIPEIERWNPRNLMIASPDAGGGKRAQKIRDILAERGKVQVADRVAIAHKTRDFSVKDKSTTQILTDDFAGMDLLIVDDILNTGGTIAAAVEGFMKRRARSVSAMFAHGFWVDGAFEIMGDAPLERIYVTNTLPQPEEAVADPRVKVISVAPLVAGVIDRMQRDRSISKDFILQSKKRGQEFLKPLYAPSILGRIRGLFDRLV